MRMPFLIKLGLVLGLIAVSGCDQKELIRRFTPVADDKMAREFLDDIRRGKTDEAKKLLVPAAQRGDAD